MKADNNNVIKILVVCNDEFSMMSVQLLHQILDLDTDKFKVGKVRIWRLKKIECLKLL